MNGKDTSPVGDQEGSEEPDSDLGAAVETLAVRDLSRTEVDHARDRVGVSLTGEDDSGRMSIKLWCTAARARSLAAQLLKNAEAADQFEEADR